MAAQPALALVSLSCRFPDASSPDALWRNVAEGRRSFRALPPSRLDLARYAAERVGSADSITPVHAGLLTDWSFDREAFRIPKRTFDSADLTHWLALELAGCAVGALGGIGRLDRTRTAVVVANTLAGEFARAAALRLRAPFLDDLLAQSACAIPLSAEDTARLCARFAAELRARFPEPNEESLAGGLANTIAGRIANYFDLKGGAYTVDGACASSLVAVANAATLIASDQADAVLVGAVDLSLDPFELVGFSRNGALAADEMRVFDARSNGFWPGEGGAFAVLMDARKAAEAGLAPLVRLRGWGMSSDGAGGLTRPAAEGQLLASRRACEAADVDPRDLDFVEAHGTGTAVGDPIEVRALAALREGARRPLPISSIKANIGHAKAAAGFAGLVKAAMALQARVIPPHVGCTAPHGVFREVDGVVAPALAAEHFAGSSSLAGVSSFGFGGINAHIVLEGVGEAPSRVSTPAPSAHDAEIFLLSGGKDEILAELAELKRRASTVSMAEIGDLAAARAGDAFRGEVRVAIITSRPQDFVSALRRATDAVTMEDGAGDIGGGVFVGRPGRTPRLGFVFPGQASPARPDGGVWRRCFAGSADLAGRLQVVPKAADLPPPLVQSSIIAASLAGLDLLDQCGVRAEIAVGHSLGEIAALAWAGAIAPAVALELARRRGQIMADDAEPGGAMVRVALPSAEARSRITHCITVACENGPVDTVLAGARTEMDRVLARFRDEGIEASALQVTHAFHTDAMAGAVAPLRRTLRAIAWKPCDRAVVSTVTGDIIDCKTDLSDLLSEQLTKRVVFDSALAKAGGGIDMFVEVGPGHGLSRLVRERGIPCAAIDAFGASLRPLLETLGELYVRGCDLDLSPLHVGRSTRPIRATPPRFLTSPCESANIARSAPVVTAVPPTVGEPPPAIVGPSGGPLEVVIARIADETGLPIEAIGPDDRFLERLHLNSLAVSRIVLASARALGVRAPSAPTEFANATARMMCDALGEIGNLAPEPRARRIGGVRPWAAAYAMRWIRAARAMMGEPEAWSIIEVSGAGSPALPESAEGWLLRLREPFDGAAAECLIATAAEAARRGVARLAIVHDRAPVSGFGRSLAYEHVFASVRVLGGIGPSVPPDEIGMTLAYGTGPHWEGRVDRDGALETPVFAPCEPQVEPAARLTHNDVALVVGGGRGITAECALRLGRSGARLILVGRSDPSDAQIIETMARAKRAGVAAVYVAADATDRDALRAAVAGAARTLGSPTVLLHAAGLNEPMRIATVDAATARRALAPKTEALINAIDACGAALRRVITFGSLIGAIGLEGEAHYALANAAQTTVTQEWAVSGRGRSALALEWSVWGGAGMGERLGTIERLSSSGVDPLSIDDALEMFDRLALGGATGAVVVTGRFGPPPGLDLGEVGWSPARFLDKPIVQFPGQEIVVETTLSQGRDPYLGDHVVDGRLVLPGAMALEAMAQAASCLDGRGPSVGIHNVIFDRAVSFERGGAVRVRIAALRSDRGIETVLLSEDDGFGSPAARAIFAASADIDDDAPRAAKAASLSTDLPADGLYGLLFFNSGRFRRLDRYAVATSRAVAVSLNHPDERPWFSSFEPQTLCLWDPGASDACLHALQIAVPHRRVLPVSVAHLEVIRGGVPVQVQALEREASAGTYVFDISAFDEVGRCVQRWSRATFKAVDQLEIEPILAAEPRVAVPYLERAAREAFGDESIAIAIVAQADSRINGGSAKALAALGLGDAVERRADGKLVRIDGAGFVSVAHCGGYTIAVSSSAKIGLDLEHKALGQRETDFGEAGFAMMEACRKFGRRVPIDRTALILGSRPVELDDMTLLALDLPHRMGVHTVAFSRSK